MAPRVVILGAGFGGLEAAKRLAKSPAHVTLIDRANYHLFQPLLYQVATAGLSPANIASPIRSILSRASNIEMLMAECQGVDLERHLVRTSVGDVPFEYLILATGASHHYYGHPEWAEFAPGLKSIDDATRIRRDILSAFERAETCDDPDERRAFMTFVIVGAGPTGVEMAGSIAELAQRALAQDFRHIDPGSARIILVEGADRVLLAFDPQLSTLAERDLRAMGVDVRLKTIVTGVRAEGVETAGGFIPSRTVIWAAGVVASPAAKWLGIDPAPNGRVPVNRRFEALPNIFAIGDCAFAPDESGKALPGVAQAAIQAGDYVAKVIEARILRRPDPEPFVYRDKGSMATIGRRRAVAQIGRMRLGGWIAWMLWLFVHVVSLVGFSNRLQVLLQWVGAYLTFARGARLITPIVGPDERV